MTKFINWKCSNGYDTQYGQMPIQNVNKTLQQFEKSAKEYQKVHDCDRVIYGIKYYNYNNDLTKVYFYECLGLTDKQFEERTKLVNNCIIYAIHK